jgi:hypothetical protein
MNYLLALVNALAGLFMACAAVQAYQSVRQNLPGAIFWALLGAGVMVNAVRLWP